MATATKLPFHFCWRNGAVTETLDAALACLEGNADDAAWHLGEGHLQHALGTQGYEALVEGVKGAGDLGVLRDRARIAIEFHNRNNQGLDVPAALGSLARMLREKATKVVAKAQSAALEVREKAACACEQAAQAIKPKPATGSAVKKPAGKKK